MLSNNIKAIIKANVPLLLEGPTGTGKTYMVMELAKSLGKTLHVINVSGELTIDSILGRDTLVDGTIVWRDGTLTNALRKGDWVLMDELNTALPEVLTIVNGILDDSRSVTLPNADCERIEAHTDFRFIATQNPANGNYAGTARLNDALINRMVKVTVNYLDMSSEIEALKKHTKLSDTTVLQLVKLARFTREYMDDSLSTRDLVKILRLKENGGLSLKDAISTVLLTRYSRNDYEKLYDQHRSIMQDIEEITGSLDKDPFDEIKIKYADIKRREADLETEKANLKQAVRKELLNDLLLGGQSSAVPAGF